ncbi:hypothetical protein GALMADRAFT_136299 [Galerina marginata CBS 339.88]|uniref:Uncharacterized protein n=1 Tax=Galerina marginata (strain CBS 339.88) TaxID=685588 RepID=A0A067TDH8_GALM3|nr:hypothetical protein GALMADRAFT_136299 [Galerina marginata CBS 339.88]
MTSTDSTELLLAADTRRFVMFPLRFPANPLQADLVNQLSGRVTSPEARCCFRFQSMMANIHTEALSKIFSTLQLDDESNIKTITDVLEHPSTKKKIRWSYSWFECRDTHFSTKLFALAVIKELFSAPTFAILAWLKNEHTMPGVIFAYEKLTRDNEWFVDLACRLFHYMRQKPTQDDVTAIILEAVDIEKNFVKDIIQVENVGIKEEDIFRYIEHVGDELLCATGYSVCFNSSNPFSFRSSTPACVKVTRFVDESRYRPHTSSPETEQTFTTIDTTSNF